MFLICDPLCCSGCSACGSACPQAAITMQPDAKGFLHPVIDASSCVNCGLCRRVCPQNDALAHREHLQVYAGLAVQDRVRARSSSGGIFSLLAAAAIRKQGVVFGAALDRDLTVRHIMAESLEEVEKLRGSKYVQSDLGDAYQKAAEQLAAGRFVLFSGTPCQIDGLYHFLGSRPKENLLTVDILCHGVPSPAVFRKFVESKPCKCVSVNFRKKDPGWDSFSTELTYENGKTEIDNSYYYFFNGSYCLRDSCYRCKYSNVNRVGDITLGDFWGYRESPPEYIENDDLGISFICINTIKGQTELKKIRRELALAERSMQEAVRGNPILSHPPIANAEFAGFWEDFPNRSWDELVEKYGIQREKRKDRLSKEQRSYYGRSFRLRHTRHRLVKRTKSLGRALLRRLRR